jgi:hypothetical protein
MTSTAPASDVANDRDPGVRARGASSNVAGPPDFRFLCDQPRRILSIGYRLADAEGPGRLDAS